MQSVILSSEETTNDRQNNGLIPRDTVAAIVANRNKALELYGVAYSALLRAQHTQQTAVRALQIAAPRGDDNRYTYHSREEKTAFLAPIEMDDRETYMKSARRIIDTAVWSHIIEMTDLEQVMDRKAKEEFHQELVKDPPEITEDNVWATLEAKIGEAPMMVRRGIALAFSGLDRRFRSHDAFKIGSRVILDRMYDEHGFQNHHRDKESSLHDIERAFMRLDNERFWSHGGIAGLLRESRYTGHGARQGTVENDYFKINVYKNGNCHLWFKRDDLVEKVNKLLAEYYGEVVGDGMTPEDDGGLFTPKTSIAKHYGFYPTPEEPADKIIEQACLYRDKEDRPLAILEPSAGTGNLARRCAMLTRDEWDSKKGRSIDRRYRNIVDCVEIQRELVTKLEAEGIYRNVRCCDFLALKPDPAKLYDRVVMNPPFDRERDIDHVMHALDFLKPDGLLVAIMSAGTEFRGTRKATAFRAHMEKMGVSFAQYSQSWTDLPPGSFASVGTYVNTAALRVWKDGRSSRRW